MKFHFVLSEISLLNLNNSKNTPLLGVRLNIVIVISVKTESGNFEEHCYGFHAECIVQIKREISLAKVC